MVKILQINYFQNNHFLIYYKEQLELFLSYIVYYFNLIVFVFSCSIFIKNKK